MNIIDTVLETSWENFLRMTGKDPAAIEEQFQQRFSGISPGYDRIVFPSPPLAADFVEELVMASQTVLACIASIPERIFANDIAAWLKFQGLDLEEIDFLLRCCTPRQLAMATQFARPDCVVTSEGIRVVEMNIAPPIGGTAICDRVFDEICASDFGRFLAGEGTVLAPPQSLALWRTTIRALGRASARRSSPIFFEARADADECLSSQHREFVQAVEEAGFQYRRGLIQDLQVGAQGVVYENERIDMVFTMFTYAEFQRFKVPRALALALVAADEEQLVDFILSPANIVFDNKCNLELLTAPHYADRWSAAERLAISRHVQTTRRFQPSLQAEAVARRTELVLKPNRQFGGTGVVFGSNVSDEEWLATLQTALETGERWVLQDVAPPLWKYRSRPANASQPFNVCLGPLLFGTAYAGTFMRLMPVVDDAIPVINASLGASVGLAAVRRR